MQVREVRLHGRRLVYRTAGDGEPLVLVHGISQDARTWEPLAPWLGDDVRLVAPDLPGHGSSDRPPGDHSIAGYATTVRDLVVALGLGRVTIVGHSLGGGVALQFAYQFPDLTGRLVLLDSGGLGRDVSPLLRAAVLPGAGPVLQLLSSRPVTRVARATTRGARALGRRRAATDVREMRRGIAGLADPEVRHAFLRTVRTSIGIGGQRVSASDRLYLAGTLPTLILWGADDRIIPPRHGRDAHAAIPGSRLEVVAGAGHFPHLDAPRRVAALMRDFLAGTTAAEITRETMARAIAEGGGATASAAAPTGD